jgi:glycosyltransferase involved in cell wall biosynthesis
VISAYPPSVGGAQLHAHRLNIELLRAGHDVHVATLWRTSRSDWLRGSTYRAPDVERCRFDGLDVTVAGLPATCRQAARLPAVGYYLAMRTTAPRLTSLYRPQAAAVIEHFQPEVAHLSRIGREWWYQAFVDELAARDIPFVLTPNHHPHWGPRRRDWWWNAIYRRAGAVLALSDAEAHLIGRLGVPVDRLIRSVVGPVGAPDLSEAPQRVEHPPTVLFLGQVKSYKGLDILYDAMVESVWPVMPACRLVVAGPWVDRLTGLHHRLRADPRVQVLGTISEVEKWQWLQRATILCVPSIQEALGGVYVEGWVAGLPAIGADIPPVRELFDRTGGGLAVEASPEAVGRALEELLGSPELRKRMGRAGTAAVAREYNWEFARDRALDAYRMALPT